MGEAEALDQKAVAIAPDSDPTAMRLGIYRINALQGAHASRSAADR